MSQALFPTLPGQAWPVVFEPRWATKVLPAVSGRETRGRFQALPTWAITLPFEFLTRSDRQTLLGLFLSMAGMWDSFLLNAGDDSIATEAPFGVGDGTTRAFQLVRQTGTYVEPVQNIASIGSVKVAGVATTAYTLDAYGLLTFTTAPASGAALTWTGVYYYRCRFDQDAASFEEFMQRMYTLKTLKLVGSPTNKLQ